MLNKEEFMNEYCYIKTMINKINLISNVLNTDFTIFDKLIDHYVYLLAKASNLYKVTDIILESLFLDTLTINIYNEDGEWYNTIYITENNLYEKLVQLCDKRYIINEK